MAGKHYQQNQQNNKLFLGLLQQCINCSLFAYFYMLWNWLTSLRPWENIFGNVAITYESFSLLGKITMF